MSIQIQQNANNLNQRVGLTEHLESYSQKTANTKPVESNKPLLSQLISDETNFSSFAVTSEINIPSSQRYARPSSQRYARQFLMPANNYYYMYTPGSFPSYTNPYYHTPGSLYNPDQISNLLNDLLSQVTQLLEDLLKDIITNPPQNNTPQIVANNDSYITVQNGTGLIPVLNNDLDPQGDDFGVNRISKAPLNGSVNILQGGILQYTPNAGFVGGDEFEYEIIDSNGNTDTATVSVLVLGAPNENTVVAIDDSASTEEGIAVNISVLVNDFDEDNEIVSLDSIITQPFNGTAIINSNGTITYTPNAGFTGTDRIDYQVRNSDGDTDTARIVITVTESSGSPTIEPGQPATFTPTDQIPTGSSVTGVASQPDNGTVTVNPDGSITYTPNAGFTGTDTFDVIATDANGNSTVETITVQVGDESNETPSTIEPGQPATINPSSQLPTGSTVSGVSSQPANGTVTVNPDGSITYTPNDGFEGTEAIELLVTDENGNTTTETIYLQVGDIPTETPSTFEPGQPATFFPGDQIEDGSTIAGVGSQPDNGNVTLNDDGTITYTPDDGFEGTETIDLIVTDENGNASIETITLQVGDAPTETPSTFEPGQPATFFPGDQIEDGSTIAGVGSQPDNGNVTLNDDGTITYTPDDGFEGTEAIELLVTDENGNTTTETIYLQVGDIPTETPSTFEPGQPATFFPGDQIEDGSTIAGVGSQPDNGNVTLNDDGTITYTPDDGFEGTEAIELLVTDENGNTTTETIYLQVGDIPTETPSTFEPGQPATFFPGDQIEDGSIVTGVASQPDNGTVVVNDDGSLTYIPDDGFEGTETIDLIVTDENGNASIETITLQVGDTPTETPSTFEPGQPATFFPGDQIEDGSTIAGVGSQPDNGNVTLNDDGTITYTPDDGFEGTEAIELLVTDENGNTSLETIYVQVGDIPANTPSAFTPGEPTTFFPSDQIPNGSTATGVDSQPANGEVIVNSDGSLTYIPNDGFQGTETFDIVVTDANGNTSTETITVQVGQSNTNNTVTAIDDNATTTQNNAVTVNVVNNDVDDEGDSISITSITEDPSNGTATFNANTGEITYTPNTGFTGTDELEYAITDSNGATDIGQLTISVNINGNNTLTASNDNVTAEFETPITFNVTNNDNDPDGDNFSITAITTDPSNGTATFNANTGEITYTPNTGFFGGDTLTYHIEDINGNTATATVNITVSPEPEIGLIAENDSAITTAGRAVQLIVTNNDRDPNGDQFQLNRIATNPINGTASFNASNGVITYTPAVGFRGIDELTYEIIDSTGATSRATVSITVLNEDSFTGDAYMMTNRISSWNRALIEINYDLNGNPTFSEILEPNNVGTTYYDLVALGYNAADGYLYGMDVDTYRTDEENNTLSRRVNLDYLTLLKSDGSHERIRIDGFPAYEYISDAGEIDSTNQIYYVLGEANSNGGREMHRINLETMSYAGSFTLANSSTGTDFDIHPESGNIYMTDRWGNIEIYDPLTGFILNRYSLEGLPDNWAEEGNSQWFDNNGNMYLQNKPGDLYKIEFTGGEPIVTFLEHREPGDTVNVYYSSSAASIQRNPDITVSEPVFSSVTARNDSTTVNQNSSATISVLSNDNDADGDEFSIDQITAQPTNGSVTINNDGTITYTPNAGYTGDDSFTYQVVDANGVTDDAIVSITVEPVVSNTVIAVNDEAITRVGSATQIQVLNNDRDPDGDLFSVSQIATQPINGTATINTNTNIITYTPNAGFTGTDTIVYEITDSNGDTDTAEVAVTVLHDDSFIGDAYQLAGRISTSNRTLFEITYDLNGNPTYTPIMTGSTGRLSNYDYLGLSFNKADGYLYGMDSDYVFRSAASAETEPNGTRPVRISLDYMVRLKADGTSERFRVDGMPTYLYVVDGGEIDSANNMFYLLGEANGNGGRVMHKINIANPESPVYAGSITLDDNGTGLDFDILPDTGEILMVDRRGNIETFDPITGFKTSTQKIQGMPDGWSNEGYSQWLDRENNLYLMTKEGDVYLIDLSGGDAEAFFIENRPPVGGNTDVYYRSSATSNN